MAINSKITLVVAAVVAMSAGFWLSSSQNSEIMMSSDAAKEKEIAAARKKYSPIQGSILSPARKISIPALTKDNGSILTLDDLTGEWHLLFFGYTNCPDVCPVTMGVAAQAKKIATGNNQMFPQVVFISVDPERDKIEMLGEYVRYFDKDFIGATGNSNLIKALTLQMSVVYMKMETKEGDGNYLIDHSSALLLLNPEGKLAAFLNPPHDPKTILKDLYTVVSQSEKSL